MHRRVFFGLFLLAAAVRLFFIFNPGFEADISFWKSWGLATYDFGIVEGMKVSNNNYPPPFAYVLGLMVFLYSLLADPHNFSAFWSNTNGIYLFIMKLFPILADFGIAWIILYIGRNAEKLGFPAGKIVIPNLFRGLIRTGMLKPFGNTQGKRVQHANDRPGSYSFYELFAMFYLLNPVGVLDGAWWGQVDAMGVFVFLLSLLFTLSGRPFVAGLFFMGSMMTKLQNMIYAPAYFLFIWQWFSIPAVYAPGGTSDHAHPAPGVGKAETIQTPGVDYAKGFRALIAALAGAFTAFIGLNIEFILARYSDRVFANLTENYDYFPWMSLNAYNLWWIVSGARGMAVSDKLLAVGIVPAKTVGLLVFSGMYGFAVLRQLVAWVAAARDPIGARSPANQNVPAKKTTAGYLPTNTSVYTKNSGRTRIAGWDTRQDSLPAGRQGPIVRTFLESLIIVNSAFFLFQTQSHDRYAFPLTVFLLLWAPFFLTMNHKLGTKKLKAFSLFYVLYSLFYFYNLHTALVANYPQNGLPLLSSLTQPFFTVGTSFVLITLFLIFLFILIRTSLYTLHFSLFTLLLITGSLFLLNKPLITRQPVSLTRYTPYISEQSYGSRQTNRTVQSSFGGPYKWTRLSVQYYFYEKGIGTHAPSKHVWNLNKKFSRFTTDFGIDTESGEKASAVFEIWGDDTLLFRSDRMGRYDNPRHAEVSVAGVNNLILITTDAGDGAYDDHTDWLSPTLWP